MPVIAAAHPGNGVRVYAVVPPTSSAEIFARVASPPPPDAEPPRVLWDLRRLELRLTSFDVSRLAHRAASYRQVYADARIGVLVNAEDALAYGIMRQFEMMESWSPAMVMVFNNADAALSWVTCGYVAPLTDEDRDILSITA